MDDFGDGGKKEKHVFCLQAGEGYSGNSEINACFTYTSVVVYTLCIVVVEIFTLCVVYLYDVALVYDRQRWVFVRVPVCFDCVLQTVYGRRVATIPGLRVLSRAPTISEREETCRSSRTEDLHPGPRLYGAVSSPVVFIFFPQPPAAAVARGPAPRLLSHPA